MGIAFARLISLLIYSNLAWRGFGIDRWLESLTALEAHRMHEELWAMIRDGVLRLPVACEHGLDGFNEALRADSVSGRAGKVLLV